MTKMLASTAKHGLIDKMRLSARSITKQNSLLRPEDTSPHNSQARRNISAGLMSHSNFMPRLVVSGTLLNLRSK